MLRSDWSMVMGILANGEKTIHSDGAKHNRSSQSALKSFDQIHLFLPIFTFLWAEYLFHGYNRLTVLKVWRLSW